MLTYADRQVPTDRDKLSPTEMYDSFVQLTKKLAILLAFLVRLQPQYCGDMVGIICIVWHTTILLASAKWSENNKL